MSPAGGERGASATVLGIDPGIAVTGFGVVVAEARMRSRLLACGVIRTSPKATRSRRLLELHEEVLALLRRYSPDVMAVEDVFHAKNARSALILGHARGAMIVAAGRCGVQVAEYSARSIKKAVVGTGAATKSQVAFMVQQHLGLRQAPQPADAADGVASALCHLLIGQGSSSAIVAASG